MLLLTCLKKQRLYIQADESEVRIRNKQIKHNNVTKAEIETAI